MIRIWIEGERQALFEHRERIEVCRDVLDGEYIVGEEFILADDLIRAWSKGDDTYRFIFLNSINLVGVDPVGTTEKFDEGVYRIVKIEPVADEVAALLHARKPSYDSRR